MLRTLLILFFLATLPTFATAQTVDPPAVPAPIANFPRAVTDWPGVIPFGHDYIIIITSRPGVRQRCSVRETTPEAVICRPRGHHKATTYSRTDIAAIIDPPDHQCRTAYLITAAIFAASLTASFFVPLAWSLTLRIFSGLAFSVFGADAVGCPGGEHDHDILIYQNGTPLTVHLR